MLRDWVHAVNVRGVDGLINRKAPLRQTYLSNRIFDGYDEIIAACCEAWRRLKAETGRSRSIASRSWASSGQNQ